MNIWYDCIPKIITSLWYTVTEMFKLPDSFKSNYAYWITDFLPNNWNVFGGKGKILNICAIITAQLICGMDLWGTKFSASFIPHTSIFDYLSVLPTEKLSQNVRFHVGLECQSRCIHQETFDICCRQVPLRFQGSEEMDQIIRCREHIPCIDVFTRRGIRGC